MSPISTLCSRYLWMIFSQELEARHSEFLPSSDLSPQTCTSPPLELVPLQRSNIPNSEPHMIEVASVCAGEPLDQSGR